MLLIVVFCVISQTLRAQFAGWKAEPFPLHQVQLGAGSRYLQLQQEENTYLKGLDSERLVCLYLLAANVSKTCNPYPHPGYYGHFIGHWLSASAMMYAATGDTALRTKMNGIIQQMQQCETAWSSAGHPGYLFPYNPNEFAMLEGDMSGRPPVDVPFYVMHKVIAGLIDQHIHANSSAALSLVTRMANWVVSNVESAIQRHGMNGWQNVLNTEWGGMNEAMYNLYAITKTASYLTVGNYFDHYSWTRPLANNQDDLTNQHANTHIPEISGTARGYEVNGNVTLLRITNNFFNIINTTRTYATGGSNDGELWHQANQLGTQLDRNTEESCTQYNILKVARYMYTWTASSIMADFYERAIMNGIVGNLNRNSPQYFYFNPLGGGGVRKSWGNAASSFVCCWGTLSESFSKLMDSIYFRTTNGGKQQIFVNQFVASKLNNENGVSLTQTTTYPIAADNTTTTITINGAPSGGFILSIRTPRWTRNSGASLTINGAAIANSRIVPGTYLNLGLNDNVVLKAGDKIVVKWPMFARWERINDNRQQYHTIGAFMYGPMLLAGETSSVYFHFDESKIGSTIRYPTGGTNRFTATDMNGRAITMIPFMDIITETYTVYFTNAAGDGVVDASKYF